MNSIKLRLKYACSGIKVLPAGRSPCPPCHGGLCLESAGLGRGGTAGILRAGRGGICLIMPPKMGRFYPARAPFEKKSGRIVKLRQFNCS
ncbi:MAG: hypothetical protein PHU23_03405 [Dehalococcoidales bacterium]|nr:hypothetical protein [Dehalococcoidales bacterium]